MKGTLVWEKDLGDKRMRNQFGEGSTPGSARQPARRGLGSSGRQSFIVALDKRTGEELWRVARDEIDTWATPLVVDARRASQVDRERDEAGPQLRSRDRQASCGRCGADDESDPVAGRRRRHGDPDERFPRQRSEGRSSSPSARGDITNTPAVAWTLDRDTPYVPSPLLYDGILYFLKSNNGILSAFDAKTGKPHYQLQRLEGAPNVFASPVGAAGRVYIPGQRRHDDR